MKSVLLNYACKCYLQQEVREYEYDFVRSLNIDKTSHKPYIDKNSGIMALITKTEATRENDDAGNPLLAMMTKTRTQMESDDYGSIYNEQR